MRGHVIVGVMTISTDVDKLYDTDLTDAAWALIAPMLPAARPGGRPRKINIRAVLNAILYLLRTGCQWRLLPREFPGWSTVYHYFRAWKNAGVWTCIQRSMYRQARRQAGRAACPSAVIMDGQSVKTTERGGIRGFDAHKRVKGRKRHILVDTLGLLIACRVEPADISDRKAAGLLLGGLRPLFPDIRTVIADAGHQSRKLARHLLCQDGWKLQIVKRRQRAFKITGLTWIVERSFAWLGRNRRLSKDYEYCVQSSETLIEIAATRLMLNRLAQALDFLNTLLQVGYDRPVGEAVYAIDDFPDDDLLWRIEWIGGVGYNTSVPSDPLMDVCMAQLPAGETNPLSARSRSSQTKRTVRIGVGLLPYISTASVWRRPVLMNLAASPVLSTTTKRRFRQFFSSL